MGRRGPPIDFSACSSADSSRTRPRSGLRHCFHPPTFDRDLATVWTRPLDGDQAQDDMSNRLTDAKGRRYEIYPKRYFDASPTWFQWNKLTASDLQLLKEEPGFEGQHIYFHLNHPIRYVRLVGLVVDIVVTRGGKYVLITLDDSSGSCVEIKTECRIAKPADTAVYPSNTVIDNLDVVVNLGEPSVLVDGRSLEIGSAVKVKGTIDAFRGTRQLSLARIWHVQSTSEEVKAWAETAQWRQEVLSHPWVLSREQRQEIDQRLEHEARKQRERERKKRELNSVALKKRTLKLAKIEAKRQRDEHRMNEGAIGGSGVLPRRVTDG